LTFFELGVALLMLSALIAPFSERRRWIEWGYIAFVLLGSIAIGVSATSVLLGDSVAARWSSGLPGGDWVVGIDSLSAVFLLAIVVVGAAAAIYGTDYLHATANGLRRGSSHALFALLLVALILVVVARSIVFFLCAWELMAIGSFMLIVTDHHRSDVRRAGLLYLAATHTGTLLLFVMFAQWTAGAADWTFASLAAARPDSLGSGSILLVGLLGFGMKAGFIPMHFWLPPAHAAAPSHVSALMSGVVIKAGIYGILRILVLSGTPPQWWGWLVLALGLISGLFGVLWALAQHDVKRLLAYHSVENIGIILMGIGVGALGAAYHNQALAVIGYGAAVFHTVNHAVFKALLFLCAGAVYRATGTCNMEELGGLARRMPLTWIGFLTGSIAIVGLPPLNGFVSEWLVYQGLFRSGDSSGGLKFALFAVPVLALIGGLALACFSKAAGVIFLGRPRSAGAAAATEGRSRLVVPSLALALVCVMLGLGCAQVVPLFFAVGATVAHMPVEESPLVLMTVIRDTTRVALFSSALLLFTAAVWGIRYMILRGRNVRSDATWACGYNSMVPRAQYTASSFAAPLVTVFGGLSGVREYRGSTVFHSVPRDLVLDHLIAPAWNTVSNAALRLRPIQQGRLHAYLAMIVIALIGLLLYLVVAPTI